MNRLYPIIAGILLALVVAMVTLAIANANKIRIIFKFQLWSLKCVVIHILQPSLPWLQTCWKHCQRLCIWGILLFHARLSIAYNRVGCFWMVSNALQNSLMAPIHLAWLRAICSCARFAGLPSNCGHSTVHSHLLVCPSSGKAQSTILAELRGIANFNCRATASKLTRGLCSSWTQSRQALLDRRIYPAIAHFRCQI